MSIPVDLKYSREHEWIRVEDDNATVIGITFHAQDQLGDVVYLELPDKGARVDKDEPFGVIESTKAVSDIFSPISGKILDVNTGLFDEPAPINREPYDGGWLLKVKLEDPKDLEDLMDSTEYQDFLTSEA